MSHTHRLLLFFLLSLATTLGLQAQRLVIAGKVSDQKTKNPVEYASVALLRTDSTVVTGTTTADDGTFSLRAKEVGSYLPRLLLREGEIDGVCLGTQLILRVI